jgi:quinol monooxygenase YgiN
MYVVCVTSKVKPEFRDAFIKATMDNAANTRKEPGNRRFDVLQAEDDPNQFFFYEAYRTKDDFAKHQQTEHYFRWRDAVKEMMSEPRKGVRHTNLYPDDSGSW